MPLIRLPVGAGGGGGAYDPDPVDVGGDGVLPGLWDQVRVSRFSPQAHILHPQQAPDGQPEKPTQLLHNQKT